MESQELRIEPRFRLKWRIALAAGEGDSKRLYHGMTHDLSLTGAAVHLDHNLSAENLIQALLLLPPLASNSEPVVLEMQARIIYSVLSSSESRFRTGLQFVQFKNNSQKLLADRLAYHAQGWVKS
jgi:hypothetical protein